METETPQEEEGWQQPREGGSLPPSAAETLKDNPQRPPGDVMNGSSSPAPTGSMNGEGNTFKNQGRPILPNVNAKYGHVALTDVDPRVGLSQSQIPQGHPPNRGSPLTVNRMEEFVPTAEHPPSATEGSLHSSAEDDEDDEEGSEDGSAGSEEEEEGGQQVTDSRAPPQGAQPPVTHHTMAPMRIPVSNHQTEYPSSQGRIIAPQSIESHGITTTVVYQPHQLTQQQQHAHNQNQLLGSHDVEIFFNTLDSGPHVTNVTNVSGEAAQNLTAPQQTTTNLTTLTNTPLSTHANTTPEGQVYYNRNSAYTDTTTAYQAAQNPALYISRGGTNPNPAGTYQPDPEGGTWNSNQSDNSNQSSYSAASALQNMTARYGYPPNQGVPTPAEQAQNSTPPGNPRTESPGYQPPTPVGRQPNGVTNYPNTYTIPGTDPTSAGQWSGLTGLLASPELMRQHGFGKWCSYIYFPIIIKSDNNNI